MHRLLLLISLLLVVAPACDRPARDAAPAGAEDETGPLAAHPPAAYERRMLFLAGPEARPVVALFDFATLDDGAGLHRAARAWRGEAGGWDSVLVAAWEDAPARAPWLIVPNGPFRLLVGDDGEVEALVYRGERSELRLVPAPEFAAWSRGRGAQLRLRSAQLARDGARTPGTLLDVQLARELPRAPAPPGATAASGPAAAPDSVAATATDAQPYDEAYVTDGEELHVVLTGAPDAGDVLWVIAGPEERVVEGARLEEGAAQGGRTRVRGPVWRIAAPDAALEGELRAEGAPLELAAGDAVGPAPVALFVVRGWVELRGVRRAVYGLVRRGQG